MLIHMQEVNFGESILLEQAENQLLVDCGAKYGHKGITAANSVKNLLVCSNKKEALVTHFDEDHYNGFIQLAGQVIFNQFYLPLFAYKKNTGLVETYRMLDDTVKIWAYQKLLGNGKKLNALHEFFITLPRLVKRRSQVRCVKSGDFINCGTKEFEIIWPEGWFMEKAKIYSPEIEGILAEYISISEYTEVVYNYTNALSKLYIAYVNSADALFNDEVINELVHQLEVSYVRLNSIHLVIALKEEHAKRFSSIISQKIKCMNDCSIVMQCGDELLMLGDIGKNIFERDIYSKFKIKNTYKAVKVSHHGTKAYYSDKLPDAKVYLISNSGKYNTRWKIYDQYPSNFLQNRMICTNTNAKRCNMSGSPCNMCRIGNSTGNRLVDLDVL